MSSLSGAWSLICLSTLLVVSTRKQPNIRGSSYLEPVSVKAAPLEDVLHFASVSGSSQQVLTVELSGGLGNQLFQLAALFSTAADANGHFSVALPDVDHVFCNRSTYWKSAFVKLKPLLASKHLEAASTCTIEQISGYSLDQHDTNCSHASLFQPSWISKLQKESGCKSVTLHGYFQNPAFFSRHLPLLRRLLWDEDAAERARARLTALLPSDARSVVSLHYRLGDYEPHGWVLEQEYYEDALRQVKRHVHGPLLCLIFSDEPQRAWSRSSTLENCSSRVLVPPQDDDVTSFYMMSLVENSVIADSSFSYWSAVLGAPNKKLVVAPDVEGPKSDCWSYLSSSPNSTLQTEWIAVPVKQVSQQALFVEELLSLSTD